MIDDKGAPRRTVTYDLAPLTANVTEIPSIPFSYFDPRVPGYRVARTRAIPLEVRGGEPAPIEQPRAKSPRSWLPLLVVAAFLLAVVAWAAARKRGEPAPDPAAAFHVRAGADLATAFIAYLAARLQCPTASVNAPNLRARLTGAGVPTELAARAASLVEDLVAARYGGHMGDVGRDRAETTRQLVDALEATWRNDA